MALFPGFLEASTIYFYPRSGYHMLALLEDGLASPLLAQIVEGIRHSGFYAPENTYLPEV